MCKSLKPPVPRVPAISSSDAAPIYGAVSRREGNLLVRPPTAPQVLFSSPSLPKLCTAYTWERTLPVQVVPPPNTNSVPTVLMCNLCLEKPLLLLHRRQSTQEEKDTALHTGSLTGLGLAPALSLPTFPPPFP